MDTAGLKKLIDEELDRRLPKESEEPKVIHKAMRYSVFSGGKRIRPILTIEACRACGGAERKALPAGCAVELIHAYSLIHDDLPSMDDDDFRRGRPSCHKKFGEGRAILAGDALMPLAFNLIAKSYEPETAVRIIEELSDAAGTRGMVGGQALDISPLTLTLSPFGGEGQVRGRINRLKTARLFEASAKIGAIAAGAGVKRAKAMAGYGLNLGEAFQFVDDILDGDGSAGACGRAEAQRGAKAAAEKAKRRLAIFGKCADRLKRLADSVLGRIGNEAAWHGC